jgi:CubicO group peptidase (beta-lactamase class C family)
MATIEASAISGLKKQIDNVTSNPDGAGGIVFCAVNKTGDLVFEHASGKLGKGKQEPMTMDTVFWIASCTKMIVGIACMQLVEQGKLALDDIELVEKITPVSEYLDIAAKCKC